MTTEDYVNISLPRSLVDEINKVAIGTRGYVTVTEFVKESCRMRLDHPIWTEAEQQI